MALWMSGHFGSSLCPFFCGYGHSGGGFKIPWRASSSTPSRVRFLRQRQLERLASLAVTPFEKDLELSLLIVLATEVFLYGPETSRIAEGVDEEESP